ncbi:hypothetical protein TrCOL_g5420 [Triparma columacea]|uniref:Uncharacterized protein n=1 Tax=Triparma columacea TaxID=722753 RepID=A0A9W7GC90_9STRA|nr:hypothetical protein TrCOL_g5420 [Triparma columacea]
MSHDMSIVRPAIIEHYLNRLDEHIMTVYKELTQIDKVTDYISEDEAFVVEARLWLPIKAGGVGLTPLASLARAAFCGANISAISLLVEREIDGVVYKAAIPELQKFIGGHMGDKDTHLRLAQYSTETTMTRFTRANALFVAYAQLQHQEATGIYNTNSSPDQIPTSGFLSSPFEGLGRDDSHPKAKITTRLQAKLHAPIVSDYLIATESFVDQQLDRSSKVREAFVYTKSYPSTKCFLHANPSRTEAISNTDMQTAICSYLGLPLPICVLHRNIPLPSGNDQLRLDIHGNNLAKATRITGHSNKTRHDNLLQLIADLSKEAGVEYTIEDTATFAPARDPRSESHLPPIIPDYKISTSSIQKLFDVKVLGHGTSGFRNGAEVGAIEARADRVTVEYKQKAWAHDQTINSNITSEILESLGGATGLVCGPRGETSKSLDELTLFLAKNAAVTKWNLMGAESIQEAKNKIKNKMKRRIGTMIAKEQAKWARTRIYQAIVDTGGGPRFGKRARRQTAQSQREQAEYAEAYAGFARGPRERYGEERRRDDDNVYGGARGNRAGNPDRHRQQGEAETGNGNRTESETGNRNENGRGDSNANGSGGGRR